MHRIDGPGATGTNKFTDGDPVGGVQATVVTDDWLNDVQEELMSILTAAAITPVKGTQNQILTAIRRINQFSASSYAVDNGTANAYAADFVPPVTTLVEGMVLKIRVTNANTGPSTFSPNGLPALQLVGAGHAALQGGELVPNSNVWMECNSGAWIILASSNGAAQVSKGLKSLHAVNLSQLGNYNSIASLTATSTLTDAQCGRPLVIEAGGTTQTLPPAASLTPGSTYIFSAHLPVTIKGNGAELIENNLGVTANTLSMQAGEQLVITTNGASWYTTAYCRSSGRLIGVQTFVASGTYTPTPGMASVIVEAQGGGGSGGGAAVPSAGNVSLGAPGGAGSYGKWRLFAASIGASQAVTIGAPGSAGSGVAGGNGGTTSVGALVSAPGGVGGSVLNNQVPPQYNGNGTASGNPTGASISFSLGVAGAPSAAPLAGSGIGGIGGPSAFGSGGLGSAINSVGNPSPNYGAGGAGCVCGSGGTAITGALGKAGIVTIWEYA
ncbi:putative Tail fiber protein [Pseudomonas sp. IT-P74]|uniref:hypothetical protein n=1 Tax=Pseudomonas sp. IT-P74 TaxID=3026445 RepID=UPI0039E0B0AD